MNHFSLEYPWVLGLLIIFIICAIFCKAKKQSIYFPHLDIFLLGSPTIELIPLILKWIGTIFAIIALASPIVSKSYSNSTKDARDIVLILDSSASMVQGNFDEDNLSKSKFSVVKELASAFVRGRESDRVGVINFADIAFIASPLSFEKELLATIIDFQSLGMAGQKTAINDALVQSYALLEHSDSKSKVAILLTDGKDNMSRVSDSAIADMISKSSIKLYTIGIGSKSDYDEKALKKLANRGDGQFFSANSSTLLQEIYKKIDKLEKTKIETKELIKKSYLFVYPLLFSILFLLFFIYYQTAYNSTRRDL